MFVAVSEGVEVAVARTKGVSPPDLRFRAAKAPALRPSEIRDIVALLNQAFGRWPDLGLEVEPLEHLRWQLDGPGIADTLVYLVEAPGRGIVGVQLRISLIAWVFGRRVRAKLGTDSALHSALQGMGVHHARRAHFADLDRELAAVSIGTTNHPAVLRAAAAEIARPGNPVRVLVKPLDYRRLAADQRKRKGLRVPAEVAAAGLWLAAAWSRTRQPASRIPSAKGLRLSVVERFDERFEALFEAARADFDLVHERSSRYLQWRYGDPRGGRFVTIEATDRGQLVGYVVTKQVGVRGYIVDLLAAPGRREVLASLVDEAIGRLRDAGSAGVSCWLARHHPYMPVLRSRGFFDSGRDSNVYLQTPGLSDSDRELMVAQRARIHITHGDSDAV